MKCATCEQDHPIEEIELFFKRPDAFTQLSDTYRQQHCEESDDLARIEYDRWFVRGILPISVEGRKKEYGIGAWVELSMEDFQTIYDLWDEPEQQNHAAFEARLANEIPSHPGSHGLTVSFHLTGPKTRPEIIVTDKSSSLGREQANGIAEDKAIQYSMHIYHSPSA